MSKQKRKRIPLPSPPVFHRRKQTASIANLPTEILSEIFTFVLPQQRDLHTLCGVCTSFNQAATRFLYRWPKFKDTFSWAQFILSLTQLTMADTKGFSSLGSLVQVLDVSAIMGVAISAPERVVPIIKPTAATRVQVKLVVKDASESDLEIHTPTTNAMGNGGALTAYHHIAAAGGGNGNYHHHHVVDDEGDDDAQITAEELAVWQAAIDANNDVNVFVNGNMGGHGNGNAAPNQGFPILHLILQQQAIALANNHNNGTGHGHLAPLPQILNQLQNVNPQHVPPNFVNINQHMHHQNAAVAGVTNHNFNHHNHPFHHHLHNLFNQPHNQQQNEPMQHRVRVTRVSSASTVERSSRIQISASSLKDLAEKCTDLLVLNLANSTLFPDTYLPQINAYISRLPYQPEEHLARIPVTVFDAIKSLILGCKKLVSLDLRGGEEITDEITLWIVDNAKSLRALNLGKCSKIKTGAAKLFFVGDPAQLKPQVVAALS
ncbi:hypothetical protein SeLEV6574_g01946 [Synchytrium endobioticum]|nr:hypothetical protein SeLEV6574_g01946 [Synchytrium endobioticum]